LTAAVFGREEELGSIQAFLDEVPRGPATLVLSGEPGIGKTTLWQLGVEQARELPGSVLSCRAAESEATLSFAALADLLEKRLDEALTSLTGSRRRALEVALLIGEPGSEASDQRAIAFAFLDVLRALSRSGPLLIAVDDIQWVDTSSARVLQFALRRVRDERVGLLATVRETGGVHFPLDLERVERLSLGPLSLGGLHHLLKERLMLNLTRPELARLHGVTGGNPFFALELGRELMRAGERLTPGRPLPIPGSLKELLGSRLARLPARTREVLLSAAALGRPTVPVLADAHGEDAMEALERAARAAVIEVDESRVRFAHPLLAAVCYHDATPWRRRAAHRLLAGVVPELEERARHLALAAEGSNPDVASTLDAAAEQAGARGATAAAAELQELAAGLTPPFDPSGRQRRLLRAADFHCFSGNRERARAIPEELLAEVPSGRERADVLFKLASARMDDHPAIIALCEEALVEAAGDDARSAKILAFRSWMRMLAGDIRGALADARSGLGRAERVGDPELLAQTLGRVAAAETWTLDITPGLLDRGVALEGELDRLLEYPESPIMALGRRLLVLGELDRSRVILAREEERASARGDEGSRVHLLFHLVVLEWYSGRWEHALRYADEAFELAEQLHDDLYRGLALVGKALVEAHLGRVDAARASAEEGLLIGERVGDALVPIWNLGVLGHVELSLGNLEAAARYLRPLPGRLISLGWNDIVDSIWPDTIETLVGLGELEQASTYVRHYEACAERLQSPWALAIAARFRGLLAAAEGDLPASLETFNYALGEHERAQIPFEQGRTLLALGSVRRRMKQKRATREALEQALVIFEQLGARLWAQRAREDLSRIAGRRPGSTTLTATEERVAALVAEGLSNKEIASALVVSVHTVEAHLSRIYRKYDIHSRAELARRIASPGDALGANTAPKV
jgi:DNA-binding CsgD family transcriptional regulator